MERKSEFSLRRAEPEDEQFWRGIESHCTAEGFGEKTKSGQSLVILRQGRPAGILDYTLLWDKLPFLNCLFLLPEQRGQGGGTLVMEAWERLLGQKGYPMALLSTQADETAQHFYRKLGYRDCGCLVLDRCPLAQPAELFFCKTL